MPFDAKAVDIFAASCAQILWDVRETLREVCAEHDRIAEEDKRLERRRQELEGKEAAIAAARAASDNERREHFGSLSCRVGSPRAPLPPVPDSVSLPMPRVLVGTFVSGSVIKTSSAGVFVNIGAERPGKLRCSGGIAQKLKPGDALEMMRVEGVDSRTGIAFLAIEGPFPKRIEKELLQEPRAHVFRIRCANCFNLLVDDSLFCQACGAQRLDVEAMRTEKAMAEKSVQDKVDRMNDALDSEDRIVTRKISAPACDDKKLHEADYKASKPMKNQSASGEAAVNKGSSERDFSRKVNKPMKSSSASGAVDVKESSSQKQSDTPHSLKKAVHRIMAANATKSTRYQSRGLGRSTTLG